MVLNREFSLSDQVTAVFPKLKGFVAVFVAEKMFAKGLIWLEQRTQNLIRHHQQIWD